MRAWSWLDDEIRERASGAARPDHTVSRRFPYIGVGTRRSPHAAALRTWVTLNAPSPLIFVYP